MSEFTISEQPRNTFDKLKQSVGRVFKERYTISGRLVQDEAKFFKVNNSLSESEREEAINKLRQTVKGRVTRTIIQDAAIGTVIIGGSLLLYKNRKVILSKFQKNPENFGTGREALKNIASIETGVGEANITEQLHNALREKGRRIEHDGKVLTLGNRLGAGGTKTVYDVELNNQRFALALPNTTDGVITMNEKWGHALKEPGMTDQIRSLGIHVNPVCEPLPVTVNGMPLTAIKMIAVSGPIISNH